MAKVNRGRATFIALFGWTDQGIRNVKQTLKRAEKFTASIKKVGGSVKDIYWTMGRYDGVIIFEVPNDETATALMLGGCSLGSIRSETLRAFGAGEMKHILKLARL
jgi:uncharacterized protein with GYD domain